MTLAGDIDHTEVARIRPTVAQYRVLVELCRDGADNRKIARRLYCSEDTVKCHIKRLLSMSGLHHRTELAVAVWSEKIKVEKPAYPPTHHSVRALP